MLLVTHVHQTLYATLIPTNVKNVTHQMLLTTVSVYHLVHQVPILDQITSTTIFWFVLFVNNVHLELSVMLIPTNVILVLILVNNVLILLLLVCHHALQAKNGINSNVLMTVHQTHIFIVTMVILFKNSYKLLIKIKF